MQKLRMALIGAGTWGRAHASIYRDDPRVELVAVCDRDGARAQAIGEDFGLGEHVYTDYERLLARVDCDAVAVVTPDFAHREISVACAQAGRHILIEKPIATTREDAFAIREAVRANGVRAMVDFHNRWNPAMYGLRQAIENGEMGEPQVMTLRLNDTVYVPTKMLSWGGTSTVVWFLGSHSLDLVTWLFGDRITRVYSVARSRVLAAKGVNTPDFFHTIVELKGGGVAHVENCWIMSTAMPTVFDFKCEFIGSEGTAFIDCSSHRMLQKFSSKEISPISSSPGTSYPDVAVATEVHGKPGGFGIESILHFADCVVHDKEPLVTPEEGVRNVAALVAVHESAAKGLPVELGA